MNTSLMFRFVTRTLSEDYRVFGNGGHETYSDSTEFDPLRKKGRIIPEEGPCAVLWEESSLIFLTVSSMQRGVKDLANRPIRFSFCEIFTDRAKAWRAFTRVISDFSAAEKLMQSLIHEKLRPGNDGEDIDFRQEEFISQLQAGSDDGERFTPCREGDVITREGDTWPKVWPREGLLLKWRNSEHDEIACERVEGYAAKTERVMRRPQAPELERRGLEKVPDWVFLLCGMILGVVIVAGIFFFMMDRPKEDAQPIATEVVEISHDVPPVSQDVPQDLGL